MELERAIEMYLSAHHGMISPKTMRIYKQSLGVLRDYLGNHDMSTVTLDDLRAYRASLFERDERYASNTSRPRERGYLSIWTIHGHVRVVRQFFRWHFNEGKIEKNPAARLELPALGNEPPKGIRETDMQKMLAVAKASPRNYALLMFLADTGCRLGGVVGLELTDLDLEKRQAIVREKGKHGRKKVRAVFFNPPTAEALRTWLEERKQMRKAQTTTRVFVGRKGPLTPAGLYQTIKGIGKSAGIKGRFNPHSFRHGLARSLLERGLDLGRVSRILGHSDEQVTAQFYGVFSQQELADAHDKYSWIQEP
ncbi:MAG: tyrosine-type recombinase/integrase [Chloroflexi bacterium]|nr:tyrosine-type recombinase/integrase [Chloroflexota bacterium]